MSILHLEATLTDRYQTTVPTAVRKALNVGRRDKIEYVVQADGMVLLRRAERGHTDPTLSKFLALLQKDIVENPRKIKPLSRKARARSAKLVKGMNIDLDAPLAK